MFPRCHPSEAGRPRLLLKRIVRSFGGFAVQNDNFLTAEGIDPCDVPAYDQRVDVARAFVR